jgi:hypothetical protein
MSRTESNKHPGIQMASISFNHLIDATAAANRADPAASPPRSATAIRHVIVGPSGAAANPHCCAGHRGWKSEGTISIGGRVVNDLEPSGVTSPWCFKLRAVPHAGVFDNAAWRGLKDPCRQQGLNGLTKSAGILGWATCWSANRACQ